MEDPGHGDLCMTSWPFQNVAFIVDLDAREMAAGDAEY